MNKVYHVQSILDYQQFVIDLVPQLKQGVLVLLEGDLGAGKTTLIAEILKHYHIHSVASPTYAFHHKYESQHQGLSMIFDHFDLYRVETVEEIESIGFWDLIQQNQSGAIFIEWPKRIADGDWPLDRKIIRIKLTIGQNKNRILSVHFD